MFDAGGRDNVLSRRRSRTRPPDRPRPDGSPSPYQSPLNASRRGQQIVPATRGPRATMKPPAAERPKSADPHRPSDVEFTRNRRGGAGSAAARGWAVLIRGGYHEADARNAVIGCANGLWRDGSFRRWAGYLPAVYANRTRPVRTGPTKRQNPLPHPCDFPPRATRASSTLGAEAGDDVPPANRGRSGRPVPMILEEPARCGSLTTRRTAATQGRRSFAHPQIVKSPGLLRLRSRPVPRCLAGGSDLSWASKRSRTIRRRRSRTNPQQDESAHDRTALPCPCPDRWRRPRRRSRTAVPAPALHRSCRPATRCARARLGLGRAGPDGQG